MTKVEAIRTTLRLIEVETQTARDARRLGMFEVAHVAEDDAKALHRELARLRRLPAYWRAG